VASLTKVTLRHSKNKTSLVPSGSTFYASVHDFAEMYDEADTDVSDVVAGDGRG
jgi:hypothetical protein